MKKIEEKKKSNCNKSHKNKILTKHKKSQGGRNQNSNCVKLKSSNDEKTKKQWLWENLKTQIIKKKQSILVRTTWHIDNLMKYTHGSFLQNLNVFSESMFEIRPLIFLLKLS